MGVSRGFVSSLDNSKRLTVTLAPGQRDMLERIALHNNTTLAHVVRYALTAFINEHREAHLRLDFPQENMSDESTKETAVCRVADVKRRPHVTPVYTTRLGRMYVGKTEDVLGSYPVVGRKRKVQLLFTSPPFALNTKKKYGNLQGQEYVDWLAAYAPLFREYVSDDGSIVIELGNGWEPGQPTMSTLTIEALLEFKRKADLHLCQEFICFNPARLPTPAQWVTVNRIRVKDAFTRVWWMSPSTEPKADNQRVLTQYSDSMRKLLERGTYNAGKRPSEHYIGAKSFLNDHGGAIPSNVLIAPAAEMVKEYLTSFGSETNVLSISNTSTNDSYQEYCRTFGITPHPARMPARLVEFFVLFLTEPGDLVLGPFAGSNTTGYVAEKFGRRWLSIELNSDYAEASKSRFDFDNGSRQKVNL